VFFFYMIFNIFNALFDLFIISYNLVLNGLFYNKYIFQVVKPCLLYLMSCLICLKYNVWLHSIIKLSCFIKLGPLC